MCFSVVSTIEDQPPYNSSRRRYPFHSLSRMSWLGTCGGKGRRKIPREYCFYSLNVPQLHFLSSCAHFSGLSFSVTISTSSRGQLMEGYLASPSRVSLKCFGPLHQTAHWGTYFWITGESSPRLLSGVQRGRPGTVTFPWFPVSPVVYSDHPDAPPCRSPGLQSSVLPGCFHRAQGTNANQSWPELLFQPIINEVWPWASRLTSLHLGFSSVKCEAWIKLVIFKLYSSASPQGDWCVSVCVCVCVCVCKGGRETEKGESWFFCISHISKPFKAQLI